MEQHHSPPHVENRLSAYIQTSRNPVRRELWGSHILYAPGFTQLAVTVLIAKPSHVAPLQIADFNKYLRAWRLQISLHVEERGLPQLTLNYFGTMESI